jgi:hypothetical protein
MASKNKKEICEVIAEKHISFLEKMAAGKEHEFLNDENER